MFIQRDVGSWAELVRELEQLAKATDALASETHRKVSRLLYRGQASSDWPLDTTLQRAAPWVKHIAHYYRIAAAVQPQIETFTGRVWPSLDNVEVSKIFAAPEGLQAAHFPALDYLVYLRHHGFPSPLLDWSKSPYVAAYFAFAYPQPKGERVAIFAYQEYVGAGKYFSQVVPRILSFGSSIRTHPRHFLQQAEYTTATQFLDNAWQLSVHSDAYMQSRETQDRLWKFTVPTNERKAVMRRLHEYNINEYSLFQSEEALVATLADQQLNIG
jgi:hypothetical protein